MTGYYYMSPTVQWTTLIIAAAVVAVIVVGVWSIVGRIRDDERRAADDRAACSFCRDLIPDSSEVMVTDAGLPQFGRRAA